MQLAVAFDDQLLGHHRRLGRDHVVAVVGVDVQARGGHDEALAERVGLQDRAGRQLAVLGAARAAERVEELVAPRLVGGPRHDRLAGVDQHRHLEDAAVDGPRHALDDERHAGRRGLDRAGRGWIGGVVGDELAGRVAVQELDLRRRVALCVERRAQRRRRDVRVAGVRRDLWAGEHRAADRVVGDHDPLAGAVGGADRQRIGAERQAGHEALEAAVGTDGERGGDIGAVDVDAQRRGVGPVGQPRGDERVAAGDQIRAVGDDLQRAHAGGGERVRAATAQHARRHGADQCPARQLLAHRLSSRTSQAT